MITRDEIRSILELHNSIMRKKEQLYYLQEKATAVPSGLSDGERVQTSPSNTADRYIVEAADLNREIMDTETKLIELQRRTSLFIDTVQDPLARKVLKYRYLECMRWHEIADLLGYTEGYLRQIERTTITSA